MTEIEYLNMFNRVQAQYQDDIKALKRVWELSHPGVAAPSTASATQLVLPEIGESGSKKEPSTRKGSHRSIADAIDKAIAEITTDFDWKKLTAVINRTHPEMVVKKSTVWQYMRKLIEDGDVAVATKGEGRKPTTYKKIK